MANYTLCVFIISFLHRILAWALSTSKLPSEPPFYIQIRCLALCAVTGVVTYHQRRSSVCLVNSAVVSDELRLKYAIFFF